MTLNFFNKFSIYRLIITLLLITNSVVLPQNEYDFDTFSEDAKSFIKQPGEWGSRDVLLIFGTAGLTFGAMHIDEYVRSQALENNQYQYSIPVEFGRIWGEPLATLFIGGGIYLHGIAAENDRNKKIGFEIGESAFFTSLITLFLKYSLGRERPRFSNDPFSFHPFSFRDDDFLSLNSGHTALAFSLSTVFANNTSNNYLKILFFTPAVLTAFSRVYQNHHWTSDVILGGIIGFSVAEFFTGLHDSASNANKNPELIQKPVNLINFSIPF